MSHNFLEERAKIHQQIRDEFISMQTTVTPVATLLKLFLPTIGLFGSIAILAIGGETRTWTLLIVASVSAIILVTFGISHAIEWWHYIYRKNDLRFQKYRPRIEALHFLPDSPKSEIDKEASKLKSIDYFVDFHKIIYNPQEYNWSKTKNMVCNDTTVWVVGGMTFALIMRILVHEQPIQVIDFIWTIIFATGFFFIAKEYNDSKNERIGTIEDQGDLAAFYLIESELLMAEAELSK